jgi:hypothetical protein
MQKLEELYVYEKISLHEKYIIILDSNKLSKWVISCIGLDVKHRYINNLEIT